MFDLQTVVHWAIMIGSVAMYFIVTLAYSAICISCNPPSDPYWIMHKQMADPMFYLVCILTTVVALLPRYFNSNNLHYNIIYFFPHAAPPALPIDYETLLFTRQKALLLIFGLFQVHLSCPEGNAGPLLSPPRAAARAPPSLLPGAEDQGGAWPRRHVRLLLTRVPETRKRTRLQRINSTRMTKLELFNVEICMKAKVICAFCTHCCSTAASEARLL